MCILLVPSEVWLDTAPMIVMSCCRKGVVVVTNESGRDAEMEARKSLVDESHELER